MRSDVGCRIPRMALVGLQCELVRSEVDCGPEEKDTSGVDNRGKVLNKLCVCIPCDPPTG